MDKILAMSQSLFSNENLKLGFHEAMMRKDFSLKAYYLARSGPPGTGKTSATRGVLCEALRRCEKAIVTSGSMDVLDSASANERYLGQNSHIFWRLSMSHGGFGSSPSCG